jgi:hypothetical protein
MKCFYCNNTVKRLNAVTCNQSCAGKLAWSVKKALKLQQKYSVLDKKLTQDVLTKIAISGIQGWKPDGFIEFWGGGGFTKSLININEYNLREKQIDIYSVEKDKELIPALKNFAYKNQQYNVTAVPEEFRKSQIIQKIKNKQYIIWLDYCGKINDEVLADLDFIKEQNSKYNCFPIIFVTLYIHRYDFGAMGKTLMKNDTKSLRTYFDYWIGQRLDNQYIPMTNAVYKNGISHMLFLGFIDPKILRITNNIQSFIDASWQEEVERQKQNGINLNIFLPSKRKL